MKRAPVGVFRNENISGFNRFLADYAFAPTGPRVHLPKPRARITEGRDSAHDQSDSHNPQNQFTRESIDDMSGAVPRMTVAALTEPLGRDLRRLTDSVTWSKDAEGLSPPARRMPKASARLVGL
jgi:hypothetical protein